MPRISSGTLLSLRQLILPLRAPHPLLLRFSVVLNPTLLFELLTESAKATIIFLVPRIHLLSSGRTGG